jgi:hypothetical protein
MPAPSHTTYQPLPQASMSSEKLPDPESALAPIPAQQHQQHGSQCTGCSTAPHSHSHSHAQCHRSRVRQRLVPALALALLSAAGVFFLSMSQCMADGAADDGSGLSGMWKRADGTGTNGNGQTPFVRNKRASILSSFQSSF